MATIAVSVLGAVLWEDECPRCRERVLVRMDQETGVPGVTCSCGTQIVWIRSVLNENEED